MASPSDTFNSHISSDDAAIFSINSSSGDNDDNDETEDPTGRSRRKRGSSPIEISQLPTFRPRSSPSATRSSTRRTLPTSVGPRSVVRRTPGSQG